MLVHAAPDANDAPNVGVGRTWADEVAVKVEVNGMVDDAFSVSMRERLAVARGDEPADLVLSGGRVLSVFTGELLEADVAIAYVAGLGRYEGRETVDVSGLILLPGFIDGHMHIESTKLMMDQFARAVLPCGTTTAVLDPHEIVNVFGLRAIRELVAAAADVPFDFYVMASPCVPESPFASSGATVDAETSPGSSRKSHGLWGSRS
ncbi:MAG: amidohydrolase family protein [Actinomycetota bacterium]